MSRSGLLRTVCDYFGLPYSERLSEEAEKALLQFFESSECLLLNAFLSSNNEISFETQMGSARANSIVFYKRSAQSTEEQWSRGVGVLSLPHSPAEALYLSLRHVYSPLLLADNNAFTAKLQQGILELESNLRVIAYGKDDDENVNVILSVEEEAEYWGALARGRGARAERDAAAAFHQLFLQLAQELKSLQTKAMPEVQECVESAAGLLDDIWRHASYIYPQSRMLHMFNIIGNECVRSVRSFASSLEVFGDDGGATLAALRSAARALGAWLSACGALTTTYWPNHSLHPWEGDEYVPMHSRLFHGRLEAVYEIRCVHNQLTKLLTPDERAELQTNDMLEALEKIDVWACTPANNQAWDNALGHTTSMLKPAEMRVAEKLKPRLHNSSTKQEFIRYKSLIERPVVKRSLHGELENLVDSLHALLREVQGQVESEELLEERSYRAPELPPVVQQIQWAKQTEWRVKGIQDIVESLLAEFEGSSELLQLAKKVMNELKNMYTRLYEDWSRQLQVELKDGSLQLSIDKPVVEFSTGSQMMRVQWEPRLGAVEAAARALAALGLPAPPDVRRAIDRASHFLEHARTLQQVASFHNTLGERMIPSTRPMMLAAALALSSLVQGRRGVCWREVDEVARYAQALKAAVAELQAQNTYLTSQHIAIRNVVAQLIDTDLLGRHGEWKKLVRSIRDIIEQVEKRGMKSTGAWRAHWDQQLYKALECQYVKTLLALHTHFSPVRVDLLFRGGHVVLQPPLEELRAQHYGQLRRLVSLPAQFVGVQDDVARAEALFGTIVHKHSWLANKAVGRLEAALGGVEAARRAWSRRAALGAGDAHALCRAHLRTPDHWAVNFKACKAYGQAVAKMTFEDEKVEWITVGTGWMRRELEAQVRQLWTSLVSSLQTSCHEDMALIASFVAGARLTLETSTAPRNARELADVSAAHTLLQEKFPECTIPVALLTPIERDYSVMMEKTVEALQLKQQTLRAWGGDQPIDSTLEEWRRVREVMASRREMFQHQAEIVKGGLTGEWSNLSASLEAWLSRWMHARAVPGALDGELPYEEVRARGRRATDAQAQWRDYLAQRDDILKECEKFNIHPEVSPIWKEAEEILIEDANTWQVFVEYDEAFTALGEQEWAVFQKKVHLLDEFVSTWSGRLEPYTPLTLYLQREINKYKDLTPMLKYLRGSEFTERHWREALSLLELGDRAAESLLLSDLLGAAPNIKRHVATLQKICASASTESAIRGALNELELWYAGARFTLTYYTDKAGCAVPIVRDFKEILNKLEEQQWVVWSVVGGGGGGGGGAAREACAAWEARLSAAAHLARCMHRAQRRSVVMAFSRLVFGFTLGGLERWFPMFRSNRSACQGEQLRGPACCKLN